MTDNIFAALYLEPMSARHFHIAARQIGKSNFPPQVEQAARAVLVDGLEPTAAATRFQVLDTDLFSALEDYPARWEKFCKQNGVVCQCYFLPPSIMALCKELEKFTLDGIEKKLQDIKRKTRKRTHHS